MLVGYFGGMAHTGATYEIVVEDRGGTFVVNAYTQGSIAQGTLYTGSSREDAFKALLKQADKKRKGSPRSYVTMLAGTISAYGAAAWSKSLDANGDLPLHDQLWQVGRPLTLLPSARRQYAAQGTNTTPATPAPAQPAPAPAPQAAPTAQATAHPSPPEHPAAPVSAAPAPAPVAAPATPYPVAVMLCEPAKELAIADDVARIRAMAEPFLSNPTWIATRKMEGRRAQIHVLTGGEVVMTNRSGGGVPCPAHIEALATKLPAGTSIDGELVGLTNDGQEALYVGMDATRQCFVAFDLLACPAMTSKLATRQDVRLTLLKAVIGTLGEQDVILLVESAADEAGKRAMFDRGMAAGWEGIVFRDATATYQDARTRAWTKVKFGFNTIDAVVMGIQPGKGRHTGRVGAIVCGLYEDDGTLVAIGEVGTGMTDAQRDDLQRRWDAGERDIVVTVRTERMTMNRQLNRPVLIDIRPAGDKLPTDCRFSTEVRQVAPTPQAGMSNLMCQVCGTSAAALPDAQQDGQDELAALREHAIAEHGFTAADLDQSEARESASDEPGITILTWTLPDTTIWLTGEQRLAA
ncbi:MAG TPA: RNA ligase family protein [Herpetosiphonaceae bacterium]